MKTVSQLIKQRRTINLFRSEKPPLETIINALNTARWVPNHHLTQPWHGYFPDPQRIHEIIELNCAMVKYKHGEKAAQIKRQRWRRIPGWLIFTCRCNDDALMFKEDYATTCCMIYALSLILWEQGIGMKWTSGDVIRHERFYQILNINPRDEEVAGMIWYGYPDHDPKAKPRLDARQMVTLY